MSGRTAAPTERQTVRPIRSADRPDFPSGNRSASRRTGCSPPESYVTGFQGSPNPSHYWQMTRWGGALSVTRTKPAR
jgi:hypothetical protein